MGGASGHSQEWLSSWMIMTCLSRCIIVPGNLRVLQTLSMFNVSQTHWGHQHDAPSMTTHAATSWNGIVHLKWKILTHYEPPWCWLWFWKRFVICLTNFWVLSVCLSFFTNHKHLLSSTENPSTDQWKRLWGFCPGGNQPWSLSNLLFRVLNDSHTSHLLLLSIPDAWRWQNRCTFPRRTYQKSARGSTKSSATVNSAMRPSDGANVQPVGPPPPCCRWGQEVAPYFSPTAGWCRRKIRLSDEWDMVW